MPILSHSSSSEIPNAFLIRALARGESQHCEGCGNRMFVKTQTGKCPFCRAGFPPPAATKTAAPARPLPFAPRVGERIVLDALFSRLLSRVIAWGARRQRRPTSPPRLMLDTGDGAHAHSAAR
jgi:hypothetical protein